MQENDSSPKSTGKQDEQVKSDLKFSFLRFFVSLVTYFKTVVNIRDNVDYEGSVEAIKKDIDFKGVNVWVLGASIVIASIGLNVNSTAVIIGAMLISPLMGPIVGVGLAVGINNFQMLTRSLKSLGTAVLISVVISTLYFLLTPFGEVQSELIARTRPNLLDVMVAIFGGVALIVAKTQRGTVASVIFGVAIATALMPPLCTAGYGLANGNWQFFLGAFYLFLINSVFIALSTWLIVKYLKFPLATYMDPVRQKKVKNYILIISLLIIVPSGFTFWNTIQESIFESNAELFISENFTFEGSEVINKKINYNTDEGSKIEVFMIGETLSNKTERELNKKLSKYSLEGVELKIYQSKDQTDEIAGKLTAEVKSGIIEEIYKKNQDLIEDKDERIRLLEEELSRYQQDSIPFNLVKQEIKIQYEQIAKMTYGKVITTDFAEKQDTLPAFFVRWKPEVPKEVGSKNNEAMQKWLRVRLNNDKVRVMNY
ncbi:MAG: DUF389 domain-containing protein [Flavobacteriales bacterium]|nr:DUF389 domain-containing protein [Flavobacteriales bacterium]MCB9336019.1 DUF389 domain-containing protein [Flavobacteriales bacterium]